MTSAITEEKNGLIEVSSNLTEGKCIDVTECNKLDLSEVLPTSSEDLDLVQKYLGTVPESYRPTYEKFLTKIERLKVPIYETVNLENLSDNFKDYTKRFYRDKYSVSFNIKQSSIFHDVLVRIHTNGVFLIALAPGNTIMQSQREVTHINFEINKIDRSKVKAVGKKKAGARSLKKDSIICQVQLAGDPTYYNIRPGVEGKILEINQLIMTKPNIIKTEPKSMGYICVMIPHCPQHKITETVENLDLLSEADYFDKLSNRINCK